MVLEISVLTSAWVAKKNNPPTALFNGGHASVDWAKASRPRKNTSLVAERDSLRGFKLRAAVLMTAGANTETGIRPSFILETGAGPTRQRLLEPETF